MKRLKIYYLIVGVPIAIVAFMAVIFFDAIAGTMKGNPHPQINYLIFALIALGCAMMLHAVNRMDRESEFLFRFYTAARDGATKEDLQAMLKETHHDMTNVLELLAETQSSPVSDVQHAALEAEIHRFEAKQNSRLVFLQFLAGMMVGLGLLGTFIGLLGALADIGALINAFTTVESGDASAAVRTLVERLSAPMRSMGVAFSASLFGVLGSLIMGVLMVGVKRCASELVSILHSRAVYLTDFSAKAGSGGIEGVDEISKGLNMVAEQSPLIKALVVALEQSERRVRDLITSVSQLSVRIERTEVHFWSNLTSTLKERDKRDQAALEALQRAASAVREIAEQAVPASYRENTVITAIEQQQGNLEAILRSTEASYTEFRKLLVSQVDSELQREQAMAEMTELRTLMNDQQVNISETLQTMRTAMASLDRMLREQTEFQMATRDSSNSSLERLTEAVQEDGMIMSRLTDRIEVLLHEQGAQQERALVLLSQEIRNAMRS